MKWFSLSYWLSTLMGRPMISEESPPSGTSTVAVNSPKQSNKAQTSVGQASVSTTSTKSTHGVSQSLSKKKQSSGTEPVKRKRGRPPKNTKAGSKK